MFLFGSILFRFPVRKLLVPVPNRKPQLSDVCAKKTDCKFWRNCFGEIREICGVLIEINYVVLIKILSNRNSV